MTRWERSSSSSGSVESPSALCAASGELNGPDRSCTTAGVTVTESRRRAAVARDDGGDGKDNDPGEGRESTNPMHGRLGRLGLVSQVVERLRARRAGYISTARAARPLNARGDVKQLRPSEDAVDGEQGGVESFDLFAEPSPARSSDGVVASAAPCGRLTPLGRDPTLLQQPLERGVQRSLLDHQRVVREALHLLGDGVAVERLSREGLEDQHLERAAEQFTLGGSGDVRHGAREGDDR